jgi:ABC-type transporter Mla MlaB component
LTRAITIIALICFLVAGAAVASVLYRGGMQAIEASTPAPVVKSPVANRETKQDRLTVASLALASFDPPQTVPPSEQLRQAYAASSTADVEAAKAVAALPQVALPAPEKPKVADKPQVQKSYALLSDAQIAGIKQRLKLSSSQESYWPAVETALKAMARKLHAARQSDPSATAAQLDPDSTEVQQLKSAAMPLLFHLREDQKEEVRKLARIIGLEKVAAAI